MAIEAATTALDGAGVPAALKVQIHSFDTEVVTVHLEGLYAATGAPLVLQDYPVVSGVRMSAGEVLEVVQALPCIAAVKAGAPPTAPAVARLTGSRDVPVFGGLGGVALVDELSCGSAGAMSGFSHPEGLRATLDAHAASGFEAALRKTLLHRRGVLDHPGVRAPALGVPHRLWPLLEQHLDAVTTTTGGHR